MGSWAGFLAGTRGSEGVEEIFGCLSCPLSAAVWELNDLERNDGKLDGRVLTHCLSSWVSMMAVNE